jgi:predicted acylesterase/phospholipase RssA
LVDFIQLDVRGRIVRRFLTHYPLALWQQQKLENRRPALRNVLFESYLGELFGDETLLSASQAEPQAPQLEILATNLTRGSLAYFTPGAFVPDQYEQLSVQTEVPLRVAVAASAAFPIFFPPRLIDHESLLVGRNSFPSIQHLTDGGVYDNLGIRRYQRLEEEGVSFDRIIVSDAVGAFEWDEDRKSGGLLKTAARASDILMKRIGDLEHENARQSRYEILRIGDQLAEPEAGEGSSGTDGHGRSSTLPSQDRAHPCAPLRSRVVREQLPHIRTDLDHFTNLEIRALFNHGHEVAEYRLAELSQTRVDTSDWLPRPRTKVEIQGPVGVAKELRHSRVRALRLFSWKDGISYLHLLALLLLAGWLVLLVHSEYQRERLETTYAAAPKDTFENLTQCDDAKALLPRYEQAIERWPDNEDILVQAATVGVAWNTRAKSRGKDDPCKQKLLGEEEPSRAAGQATGGRGTRSEQPPSAPELHEPCADSIFVGQEGRGLLLICRVVQELEKKIDELSLDGRYRHRLYGAYIKLWSGETAVKYEEWPKAVASYDAAVEEYKQARTIKFTDLHLIERLVCNTAVEAVEAGLSQLEKNTSLTEEERLDIVGRSIGHGEVALDYCGRSVDLSTEQDGRPYWPALYAQGKTHVLLGRLCPAEWKHFDEATAAFVRAYQATDRLYFERFEDYVGDIHLLCDQEAFAGTFPSVCRAGTGKACVDEPTEEAQASDGGAADPSLRTSPADG